VFLFGHFGARAVEIDMRDHSDTSFPACRR